MFYNTMEVQGVGTFRQIGKDANHTLEVSLGDFLRVERHFDRLRIATIEIIMIELRCRAVAGRDDIDEVEVLATIVTNGVL
jgi:hypothetical protein